MHNGLVQFVMATQSMDDIITAVKNQVRSYQGCPTALIQGGSNMTGTDLCVNKPHCAEAVRP